MTRPSILRRVAVALGISSPAASETPPAIAAAVAGAEAVSFADAEEGEALPAAPITPATGRRRRRASAAEVAKGIAYDFVDHGLVGYPMLPDDVDAAGEEWCAARDLDPAPPSLVREALAALPGVTRSRTRLRADEAAHVALARRLRRMGRQDDRATLFTVSAVPNQLALNPSPVDASVRAMAGARAQLAPRVFAADRSESTDSRAAEVEGEAESAEGPLAGRSAA